MGKRGLSLFLVICEYHFIQNHNDRMATVEQVLRENNINPMDIISRNETVGFVYIKIFSTKDCNFESHL